MNKILVTGLCSLHWGRLQYGNVGNYYIVEPLFKLINRTFPDCEILTTFQMDQGFIDEMKIKTLPLEYYYAWKSDDVTIAENDYDQALMIARGEKVNSLSPYINVVLQCQLVINVSGDMWGNNAEHVGHARFKVDCLKMRAAQVLGIKTVLYAVTPGPFDKVFDFEFAKETFENFTKVFVREKVSISNLQRWGLSLANVEYAPCPSFIFESNREYKSTWTEKINVQRKQGKKVVGMTFGGFNMPVGPYDMWPREESQYTVFCHVAEKLIKEYGFYIVLFSHTNGFELPPAFKLKNGRDFDILKRFYEILGQRSDINEEVLLIDEPLLPKDLKGLIGQLDMLLTGRVHASVASTSSFVPTVFMEYDGRVIYSDKMTGFSSQIGMERFVCSPSDEAGIIKRVLECLENSEKVKSELMDIIPNIQKRVEETWIVIKNL